MRSSLAFVAAFASFVAAALKPSLIHLDDIPEFTTILIEVPGLTAQPINFNPTAAASFVAAQVTPDPVTQRRRGLEVHAACSPERSISNTYNVKPASVSGFQSDLNAAAAAQVSSALSGYRSTLRNSQNAAVAYGYLGYTQITSYNPTTCATKCNFMTACVGFKICKLYIQSGTSWQLTDRLNSLRGGPLFSYLAKAAGA